MSISSLIKPFIYRFSMSFPFEQHVDNGRLLIQSAHLHRPIIISINVLAKRYRMGDSRVTKSWAMKRTVAEPPRLGHPQMLCIYPVVPGLKYDNIPYVSTCRRTTFVHCSNSRVQKYGSIKVYETLRTLSFATSCLMRHACCMVGIFVCDVTRVEIEFV